MIAIALNLRAEIDQFRGGGAGGCLGLIGVAQMPILVHHEDTEPVAGIKEHG